MVSDLTDLSFLWFLTSDLTDLSVAVVTDYADLCQAVVTDLT